jgi:hypothetical protein
MTAKFRRRIFLTEIAAAMGVLRLTAEVVADPHPAGSPSAQRAT